MIELSKKIATELSLSLPNVAGAIRLMFEEDCTIPFVARYRKEVTGSMDEVNLRDIRDRYAYLTELEQTRTKYLQTVEEFCKQKPELLANFPQIKAQFMAAETKQQLEDLYLPYKPKRRTRAQVAKEKGLEGLLDRILTERATLRDLVAVAKEFVSTDKQTDKALFVANEADALAGAADILAERINETADIRARVRELSFASGYLVSKKAEFAAGEEIPKTLPKYENYFDYKESVNTAPSHRVMAVRRGEAEKCLRVSIEVDSERIVKTLQDLVIGADPTTDAVRQWLLSVSEDSYKRLLSASIETEVRMHLKNNAETEAIRVFAQNLENLLLLPPIPGKIVLGVDPGLRTGSKLAVVDATGKLLDSTTVHPIPGKEDHPKSMEAKQVIANIVKKHGVTCIAIGNGTGSREIDSLIIAVLRENHLKDVKRLVVNEAGASVYSTDEIAREEFPDLDPTIRSAISIARRLQDPLAELVKIDPRSIGVGQYQHDLNVSKLGRTLGDTVESAVNKVGVNINTASYKLLSYVSGIGGSLAKNIVTYRNQNGPFKSRLEIEKVSGFGPKAFQQAAGFLRIPGAANPLDNSGVHPERYHIVDQIVKDLGQDISLLIGNEVLTKAVPWEKYVNQQVGMPTLLDISAELTKPGRDPREDGVRLTFSEDVATIEDLKIGMKLKGTVTNVAAFGAFVDIGVHQDGLVHISELCDKFIKNPSEVVSVGDVLDITVIDVDVAKRRISLSCKSEPGQRAQEHAADQEARSKESRGSERRPPRTEQGRHPDRGRSSHTDQQQSSNGSRQSAEASQHRSDGKGRHGDRGASRGQNSQNAGKAKQPEKQHSLADLLSKFNQRV